MAGPDDFTGPGPQIPDFLRPPLVNPDIQREIFRERQLEQTRNARDATLAGLPAPALPSPTPVTPVPFPVGPAANDPVAGFSKLGSILKVGGVVVTGAIIARDLAFLFQEQAIDKMLIEQDLELETILTEAARKKAAETPVKVSPEIILVPPTPEIPEIIVTAPAPTPGTRPEFDPEVPVILPTAPVPKPAPTRVPSIPAPGLPRPSPQTAPSKSPKPAPTRRPARLPGGAPFGLPGGLPAFFPLPFSFPVGSPRRAPIGDNLTRLETPVQQSPTTRGFVSTVPSPQAQADAATERQCRERDRKKRRKNRCEEGFFRDTLDGKTDFTVWREVNCVTRKEIGDQSVAIDIFGGR